MAKILPPNSNTPVTQTIKAFIDDTNLFISQLPNQSNSEFQHAAQMDTNQWHGLLQACTGSKLNIKKCFISEVKFEYNQSGNLTFRPHHQDDPAITLIHTNGTREPLKYTKSNEGICHLSIQWKSNGRRQDLATKMPSFQNSIQQVPTNMSWSMDSIQNDSASHYYLSSSHQYHG